MSGAREQGKWHAAGPAAGSLLALALAVVAASPVAAESPSAGLEPIEHRIVDVIDTHNSQAVELLERVVEINSGTLNFDGVREVGQIFAGELESLGFATRWLDGSAFERAGHLVAERAGDGPRVLLIGHLDTVFEPDSLFQHYAREAGADSARGPGVTDMKGGNVVLLYALKALEAVGVLRQLDVTVVLTGDEEKPGRPLALAREVLTAREADVALGFEDGDSDPATAVIARRGATGWQLRVTGVRAHSSQLFAEGVGAGAIYELARILSRFYQELSGVPNLTFNPGVMLGGTTIDFDPEQARGAAFGKDNVVASSATAAGDLRALSAAQYEQARATMQRIVSENLPATSAELTFAEGYPPLAPTAGNRQLLELYSTVSRELGLGPVAAVDPRRAGAADVSFVAERVPRVLDGLGLMGGGGHTTDETADLRTLPTQTQRAALLLYRLRRLGAEVGDEAIGVVGD